MALMRHDFQRADFAFFSFIAVAKRWASNADTARAQAKRRWHYDFSAHFIWLMPTKLSYTFTDF